MIAFAAIVAWGVLSHTISADKDFLSTFLGGLANFLFFVVGLLSDWLVPKGKRTASPDPPIDFAPASRTSVAVTTALAFCVLLVIFVLFLAASLVSIDQMAARRDATFTDAGYRDIQTYFAGYIMLSLLIGLLIYFFALGASRRGTSFSAILFGCAASYGLIMLLYLIYGMFFPMQVTQYLHVEVPEALGPFRPFVLSGIGWSITAAVDVASILIFTTILWLAAKTGGLTRRAFGRRRDSSATADALSGSS